MRYTAFLASMVLTLLQINASAQCAPAASAVSGLTLTGSAGGTENRSGLAFNPQLGLYYSVNAGSANYPLDTYYEDGTLAASVVSAFDYRGAWWEPNGSRLLGNGFGTYGIFDQALQVGTGLPLGSGTVVLTSNQPDAQSIGDLDTDAGEIIYYYLGSIHRYSATTNALLGTYAITGLPVAQSNLNNNTAMYIGCPGKEIGLYDHVNRQVLYLNKATGAYSGSTQLPADAPQRVSFGLSYANGSVWLYELGAWHGYDLGLSLAVADWAGAASMRLWPNPATDQVQVEGVAGQGTMRLVVMDMAGREVLRQFLPSGAGVQGMDVSALPAGSYTVQVRHATGARAWPLVIAR